MSEHGRGCVIRNGGVTVEVVAGLGNDVRMMEGVVVVVMAVVVVVAVAAPLQCTLKTRRWPTKFKLQVFKEFGAQ